MLQLPKTQEPRAARLATPPTPEFHSNVPDFIKALPDDEAALIPVYMAYSIAARTFSAQMHVSWLKRTIGAGQEALEVGYERLQDILSYVAGRLRALEMLRDGWWEYHYLAALTEYELLCCNDADEVISAAAKASVVVRSTNKGRA